MSRRPIEEQIPDLFSTEHVGVRSTKQSSQVTTVRRPNRPILPKDLRKAITYLDDTELDRLFRATVDEATRRGRLPESLEARRVKAALKPTEVPTPAERLSRREHIKATAVQLTSGQVNAVRSAFKAGVTLSRIARQFGLSQSDVRRALASADSKR